MELDKKWSGLLEIREEVLKAIEVKRMAGEVGSSLEAKVVLYSDKKDFMKLLKENMSALPAFFIL